MESALRRTLKRLHAAATCFEKDYDRLSRDIRAFRVPKVVLHCVPRPVNPLPSSMPTPPAANTALAPIASLEELLDRAMADCEHLDLTHTDALSHTPADRVKQLREGAYQGAVTSGVGGHELVVCSGAGLYVMFAVLPVLFTAQGAWEAGERSATISRRSWPEVIECQPKSGSVSTAVRIIGRGFQSCPAEDLTVYFGEEACASVQIVSDSELVVLRQEAAAAVEPPSSQPVVSEPALSQSQGGEEDEGNQGMETMSSPGQGAPSPLQRRTLASDLDLRPVVVQCGQKRSDDWLKGRWAVVYECLPLTENDMLADNEEEENAFESNSTPPAAPAMSDGVESTPTAPDSAAPADSAAWEAELAGLEARCAWLDTMCDADVWTRPPRAAATVSSKGWRRF